MSDTLGAMRQRLNAVITEAADQLDAERSALEQQLAGYIEAMTLDSACRASYCDGRSDERHRCLLLLDERINALKAAGRTNTTLEEIRDAMENG